MLGRLFVHRSLDSIAMKFKFCGDGDCPLWALAALHALSSLPAQIFRALLDRVLTEDSEDEIMQILKDTSLASREESARAAAVIRWVVHSAWSCACPGAALARDLGVLGVPRALAAALADKADERRAGYEERARDGVMVNKLTDITAAPAPEGTVDAVKLSLQSENLAGDQNTHDVIIEKTQAKVLLEELKKAYKKFEEVDLSREE